MFNEWALPMVILWLFAENTGHLVCNCPSLKLIMSLFLSSLVRLLYLLFYNTNYKPFFIHLSIPLQEDCLSSEDIFFGSQHLAWLLWNWSRNTCPEILHSLLCSRVTLNTCVCVSMCVVCVRTWQKSETDGGKICIQMDCDLRSNSLTHKNVQIMSLCCVSLLILFLKFEIILHLYYFFSFPFLNPPIYPFALFQIQGLSFLIN